MTSRHLKQETRISMVSFKCIYFSILIKLHRSCSQLYLRTWEKYVAHNRSLIHLNTLIGWIEMNEQTARKDQCFLFWFVLSGGVSYVVQEDSGLRTQYPFLSPSSWYYRCLPSFYIGFPTALSHCTCSLLVIVWAILASSIFSLSPDPRALWLLPD